MSVLSASLDEIRCVMVFSHTCNSHLDSQGMKHGHTKMENQLFLSTMKLAVMLLEGGQRLAMENGMLF